MQEGSEATSPVKTMDLHTVMERLREKYDPEIYDRAVNIYQLGSRVYGTATETSDWDFMMVVTHSKFLGEQHYLWECYDDGEINVAMYDQNYFGMMVREHRMEAIECVCLPEKNKWLEKIKFELVLDLDVLRKMVSWIARLRMSMARKRMKGEPYKAKKCIFHGLRYLTFGIQIIQQGRIADYSEANHYLKEVMDFPSDNWEDLSKVFAKQTFPLLREKFNASAPFNEFYSKHDLLQHTHTHLFNARVIPTFVRQSDLPMNLVTQAVANPVLALQRFLNERGLDTLIRTFLLRTLPHTHKPNLVHFSPSLNSPMNEQEVIECGNGLILDADNGWKVVSNPFFKFFNYGQVHAKETKLDWKTARVFERIDGIQATLYWYDGKWEVASKWEPDATIVLAYRDITNQLKKPFADMFWDIWAQQGYSLPQDRNQCYTFCFTTNRMRFVVNHPKDEIFLIGVRNLDTLKEEDFGLVAQENNWASPPLFSEFTSLEDTVQSLDKLNPFLSAGYVAVDAEFNRLGFKCRQYVAVEYTIGLSNTGFGPMNLNADSIERAGMIEMIRWQPRLEEFLFYFPRWLHLYNQLSVLYQQYCEKVAQNFKSLMKEIDEELGGERKDFERVFAAKAREYGPSKGILFELKKGTVLSVEEYIQVTRNKAVLGDFLQHMNGKDNVESKEKEDDDV